MRNKWNSLNWIPFFIFCQRNQINLAPHLPTRKGSPTRWYTQIAQVEVPNHAPKQRQQHETRQGNADNQLEKGSTGRMLNLMLYPSCPLFHNQSTIFKLATAKKKKKLLSRQKHPKKKKKSAPLEEDLQPLNLPLYPIWIPNPTQHFVRKSRGVVPAGDWRPQQISPFGFNAGNGTTSCNLSFPMRYERFLRKTKISFYLGSFPLFLHFFSSRK